MTINARTVAKFFIYLAPLSVLIVVSNMFFPFIVGKAIFFRVVIACGTLAYAAHLLFWSSAEERADAKAILKNPIFLSISIFTLLFLLASAFAADPQMAFWSNFERGEGGLQMLFYALFFALLTLIIKTKEEWMNYLLWLVPVGVMVSLYAVGQRMNYLYINNLKALATATGSNIDQKLLQADPWSGFFGDGSRISGTLGNPLYISIFILFILFFVTLLFSEKIKYKAEKIVSSIILLTLISMLISDNISPIYIYTILISVLLLIMLLVTQRFSEKIKIGGSQIALAAIAIFEIIVFSMADSRNGLAGVVGGATAFLIIMVVRSHGKQVLGISLRNLALAFLAFFVILGGLFYTTRTSAVCASYGLEGASAKACLTFAGTWTKVPIVNRFAKDRVLSGLDDRIWTWGTAVAGIIERPILGWGAENFPFVFDRYYNVNHYGGDSWFDRAHDVYLDYLIDGGVILLTAYLAIWFFYFREVYKKRSQLSLFITGLLVGFPIAYLVANISAFEVLPIYLMLYIFFALNIRLHGLGRAAIPELEQKSVTALNRPGLISFMVMGGLLILAALSFYYADYRPYFKNRQLLDVAAGGDSADPQAVYDHFLKALDYSSPIGQQETVQYFLLFVNNFLEANSQDKNLSARKEQLLGLIAQADKIYTQNENSPNKAVGVKTLSYLGLIHLRAAVILHDTLLLDSAQKLFEHGLTIAPTRLEFIYPLLDIAVVKHNRAMAKPLLALAKSLRPDLLPRNAQYEQALSEATSTASSSPKTN